MIKLISLLTLIPSVGFAAGEYCKLHSEGPVKIVHIDNSPQWFAKVRTQGDYIFYIHQHEGNHMLSTTDKDDKTRDFRISGTIDPVPSPDGKILTVPGMEFYLFEDLLKDKENVRPFHTDSELGGVYQSVALLKIDAQDSNKRTYRVVTDRHGSQAQYRDYEIDFNQSPPGIKKFPVTQHCPGKNLSTIMVSKTGRYLTGFDLDSNTTKIWDMVDQGQETRCRELMDLGYGAGKVEFNIGAPRPPEVFNFEDSDERIVFHLDYFASNIGNYFPNGVEPEMAKNVYTMDLEAPANRGGQWKLKASNIRNIVAGVALDSGGYYPSFYGEKMIAVAYDDNNSFSYRFYNVETANPYEFYLPPPSPSFEDAWRNQTQMPAQWKERFHRAAAIGALWAFDCIPDEDQLRKLTGVGSTTYFLGLSKEDCKTLVTTKWDAMREQVVNTPLWGRDPRFSTDIVKNLSVNDLVQACDRIQPHATPVEPEVIGTPVASAIKREHMMSHYCMGCHVTGASFTGILGDVYPNMVNFKRDPDTGESRTHLSHLLASKRRVQTGIEHQQSGATTPRPPDSMPPANPFATVGTDFDHGEAVKEMIEEDLQAKMNMPQRVPLWLREDVQQAVATAEGAPGGGVFVRIGNERVERFSMPQTPVGRTTPQEFLLVNESSQEIADISASAFQRRGFFYPGGLFPGEGGTCGSHLPARSSCKFVIGFSPSSRRQMYRATVILTYSMDGREKTLELPIDGITTAVANVN